jgi:ribose transport system permease protein
VIIFAIAAAPGFLTVDNIRNLLSQNAPTGIVALAMTLLILSGDFDLSVGGIYAIAAVEFASLTNSHGLAVAVIVTLVIGLAAGLLNGLIVVGLRVNSFIATLGTGSVFTGIAYQLAHNTAIFVSVPAFSTLGAGRLGPVPYDVILLAALAAVATIALRSTIAGRHVYAVGANREAARLAGVRVYPIRLVLFALVGLGAALGGMVFASQVSVGQATIGTNLPLDTIAIVVIGGTALTGGEGGILRTICGLLILAVLDNALNALAVNSSVELVIQGAVLVFAVAANPSNLRFILDLRRSRSRPPGADPASPAPEKDDAMSSSTGPRS